MTAFDRQVAAVLIVAADSQLPLNWVENELAAGLFPHLTTAEAVDAYTGIVCEVSQARALADPDDHRERDMDLADRFGASAKQLAGVAVAWDSARRAANDLRETLTRIEVS